MADLVTSSSIYPSFVSAIQEADNIKGEFYTKNQVATYTSNSNNVSNIVHNLLYDSVHDDLLVFYNGILLKKDDNYTENVNTISIDLNGWTVSTGEAIFFKLYKRVH